jgi:hypothetical protein
MMEHCVRMAFGRKAGINKGVLLYERTVFGGV